MILTSTVVASIITAIWEFIKNKIDFTQSKHLQIDNFYREVSGKSLHKVLEDWSELLFFALDVKVQRKLSDTKYMSELLQRTYIYSSAETIKRLVNFQQYLYKSDKVNQDYDSYTVMVLVAGVIASIKKDFTGETVGIKDILRIKLTDVDENIDKIEVIMIDYGYK